MIEILNFNKREIYVNYNLKIEKGITFFKGKNGSGKTTLFDCIAGIDKDYKGSIIGNGNCVYLNQNLYFSGRLRSKDLVKFIYGLDGVSNGEKCYRDRMLKYSNRFDFISLLNKKIGILSGGELKLLFFSTISSLNKDIYIFDEPYSSVDHEGKTIVNDIIFDLVKQDKTILISSHEEEFLNTLADVKCIDV